jgi:hypothetical protein
MTHFFKKAIKVGTSLLLTYSKAASTFSKKAASTQN